MKRPSLGAIVWFVAFALLMSKTIADKKSARNDENIKFPIKFFNDDLKYATGDHIVSVEGTLSGDGVTYKNNTMNISCSRERMECAVSQIYQIGLDQTGSLEAPTFYKVVAWNDPEIIAEADDYPIACAKTTINVERTSKEVVWVREPIHQTSASCRRSDSKTYKWTIEDSLYLQRANKR
jgi:hypothetical protein